jgi:predicted dehydrogenase
MGPYYLTALVSLLGPVARVSSSARISFAERIATSKMLNGERIPVETPTHVASLLEFAAGPVGTMITSFDIKGGSELPRIEIYGSEGTLSVPDPNTFWGPVRLKRAGEKEWREIPLTHSPDVRRGVGVADMAYGITSGEPHRASGELAYHVLELMEAILLASDQGRRIEIVSTCDRPEALPGSL